MKKFKKLSPLFLLILLPLLASCVETVVVSSIAGGVVVTRDKTFTNTRKDIVISTVLGSKFLANGLKNLGNSIDTTVNEGRVLLTGIVRDAQKAKLAQEIAWKVAGVKEVIDEIQVRDESGISGKDVSTAFRDYAITTEIETKLLFERNVSSLNYQVTTVGKTVYFLGVAENESELRRVLSMASKVNGVEKVINHVILKNDDRRS